MKVVLVLGGRGLRPGWVARATEELGVKNGQVELSLVTWHPPAHPLPVAEHWVVGPSLRVPVRLHPVSRVDTAAGPNPDGMSATGPSTPATDEQGSTPVPAADDAPDTSLVSADDPSSTAAGPALGDTATAAPLVAPATPAAGVQGKVAAPLAPLYSPARLRAAAGWRLRRLRLAARQFYRGSRGRGTLPGRALFAFRHLPHVQRLRADRVATEFAVRVTREAAIREAARGSVVVVGVDGNAHRAVWMLAKRVSGPAVVIGLPSARRVISDRLR